MTETEIDRYMLVASPRYSFAFVGKVTDQGYIGKVFPLIKKCLATGHHARIAASIAKIDPTE